MSPSFSRVTALPVLVLTLATFSRGKPCVEGIDCLLMSVLEMLSHCQIHGEAVISTYYHHTHETYNQPSCSLPPQVHTAFLEAGAEVLVCGSYQASVAGFQQHLSTTREEALELIERSATLALNAVQEFEGKGESGGEQEER